MKQRWKLVLCFPYLCQLKKYTKRQGGEGGRKSYKMSVECADRRNNFAARKIFLPDWWLGNYSIGLLRADN